MTLTETKDHKFAAWLKSHDVDYTKTEKVNTMNIFYDIEDNFLCLQICNNRTNEYIVKNCAGAILF